MLEMGVGGAEDEIVLEDQSGDPEVVGRDGGTLVPKLEVELSVVMRGLLVGQEDGNPGAVDESLQIGGVGGFPDSRPQNRRGVRPAPSAGGGGDGPFG